MKRTTLSLLLFLISIAAFSQDRSFSMKKLLSEYKFPTQYVAIDSTEIAYVKKGNQNKTLLFVHGLSSNIDAWSQNFEALSTQFTCVALDLPGYGKSSKVNADYTPTFFSEIINKFIEVLNLENVVLIGHSMGGQAAIKFAVTYPDKISKLILIAPAGIEQFSKAEGDLIKATITSENVKNTSDEQIEKNYEFNFYVMPEEASAMIEDRKNIRNSIDFDLHCKAISKSVSGMLDEPVYEDLKNISHETLVIYGANDFLIPNKYLHASLTIQDIAAIADDQIENSQVELVKESGHFVQFEKPKEVNQLIMRFLQ